MVIYIEDVLARRHAAAPLATNRVVAAGGSRDRSHAATPHARRAESMTTLLPAIGMPHAGAVVDLSTIYAEASLV